MPHIFDRRANSPQLDPEAADVTSNKHGSRHSNDIEEEEEPRLSIWGALLLLVVATIIGGVTAGFIVRFSASSSEPRQTSDSFAGQFHSRGY